ncbi:putative Myb-like DNA-binding protein, partial [Naviculisporaceae sp. PSN 640]
PQNHHRRGPWSQHEDNYLMRLVQEQGALNWVRISTNLGTRTPKQCRERYHQNLKPSLNHEPITAEEGVLIERLVQELGKRWAEIARRLKGRSDNAVKNWWNGSQNRRKRHDKRRSTHVSYEDRPELASYDRNHIAIPRTLPMPSSRPHPPPLHFSGFYESQYNMESPLSSPSVHSPESELAPSLMSDVGSHYSTSPRSYRVTPAELELPPLKIASEAPACPPRTSVSPGDAQLPPLSAMVSRMDSPSAYATSPDYARSESSHRFPPMSRQSDYFSAKSQYSSHLPTAPSSP